MKDDIKTVILVGIIAIALLTIKIIRGLKCLSAMLARGGLK